MSVTRPSPSKYICGMVASLVIFLAGGWLILAPFALGYQPSGADWVSQTTNNFVVGICVAVVALVAKSAAPSPITKPFARASKGKLPVSDSALIREKVT